MSEESEELSGELAHLAGLAWRDQPTRLVHICSLVDTERVVEIRVDKKIVLSVEHPRSTETIREALRFLAGKQRVYLVLSMASGGEEMHAFHSEEDAYAKKRELLEAMPLGSLDTIVVKELRVMRSFKVG